ncbi:hypothetical protein C8J56DRAFT_784631 [Mycena floridula]|nr:hypothetical protein C8J56DRAFT_784631 [Mycena floridula]
MAELGREYYEGTQLDETTEDPEAKQHAINDVLEHVTRPIPEPDTTEMKDFLTEEDVEYALKNSANGKAARINGIITEFWKALHRRYQEKVRRDQPGFNIVKVLTTYQADI